MIRSILHDEPLANREQEAAAPSSLALPDVNAETYPYERVQYLLDETANFNIFAVPENSYAEKATLTPDSPHDFFGLNGGYGLDMCSALLRLETTVQTSPNKKTLRVAQSVGDAVGKLHCRCLFTSANTPWAPHQYPAALIFDPYRSQRFVMQDGEFTFGESDHFRVYGIGRTFPVNVSGRPRLLAAAVGTLIDGAGKFKDRQATFVLTGSITSSLGFLGNITCRVLDPDHSLRTDSELPSLNSIPDPDNTDTYFALRLTKKDRHVRTVYGPPVPGGLVSLVTPSEIRSVQYDFTTLGHRLRSHMTVGQVIGHMDATVVFDLLAPPGTPELPVPFTTQESYQFCDSAGNVIGTISAGITEGVSFSLTFPGAPGQKGVRFAGFGPIQNGTGVFANARGMLTVNSLIGISPHALSLMHVLHILDPLGEFRVVGRSSES
jgi:hypothetical protein